uniref:NADH-ubiquinone oxidoreductase chain 5 n=1 Tax=Ectopleura larynx TaxID=264052 RepID=G9ISH8_9CNID|nr:NADH dehydrogenase subunit 5 [Ectopleura larynx]
MFLLIIFLPLLSSFISGMFGWKIGYKGVKLFPFIILLNFVLSISLIIEIQFNNSIILLELVNWFELGILENKVSFRFDLIVGFMLVLVNLVSFCVHLYSCSYMSNDPHLPRFISYLSLFTFFMIVLITSSNLIQLFIGWEGVGLCSYLLINFWFSRIQANKSAIKAMIVNKIGDIGLLIGMVILFIYSGSFQYNELFSYFSVVKINKLELFLPLLLIIIGIIGKSAQIGLHIWLPDAMEGPTPVSALIHAATMVTAGVFLLIRISPLFEILPEILILIILIGSLTSFFSAVIGLTQNDFKKVIAYSTCSQLGYMITICGFSEYALGLFHLINHGFFKALLFLSAGSIIHALSDNQDMRKSGGLKNILPLSFILILVGSLSLMGLPFLTGFYSKDLILELIKNSNILFYSFLLCLSSAFLTAFYSFRLIYFTFLNYPQLGKIKINNISEGDLKLISPLIILCLFSLYFGYLSHFSILGNPFPPLISNQVKFLPLFLSLIGLFLALLLGLKIKSSWFLIYNKLNNFFYNLSINLWYFDLSINKFLVKPLLNLGYDKTYKLIDSQIIEKFGPSFFYSLISLSSNKLSKFHSGKLSLYLFLLILLSLIILIFSIFFWLWRRKD